MFDNHDADLTMEKSGAVFIARVTALIVSGGRFLAVENVNHPDMYYTVGGRIRFGEDTMAAVLREAREETGHPFEIDRLRFVEESFFILHDKKFHLINFHYLMKSSGDINIADGTATDQPESERLVWLDINSLNKYNLKPSFLKTADLLGLATVEHIITKEY